ncbi:MAG TPA: element excision factor XisI family protein, partial [Stenomitos sp.]
MEMDSTFTCQLLPFLVDDTNHIFIPSQPTRARGRLLTEIAYCRCRGGRGEAMDTTTRERDIVKQVIQRYAQFKPSHGDIRLDTDTVFDDTQNRYALMQVGWDRGRRVRGNLIYVTLSEGKV